MPQAPSSRALQPLRRCGLSQGSSASPAASPALGGLGGALTAREAAGQGRAPCPMALNQLWGEQASGRPGPALPVRCCPRTRDSELTLVLPSSTPLPPLSVSRGALQTSTGQAAVRARTTHGSEEPGGAGLGGPALGLSPAGRQSDPRGSLRSPCPAPEPSQLGPRPPGWLLGAHGLQGGQGRLKALAAPSWPCPGPSVQPGRGPGSPRPRQGWVRRPNPGLLPPPPLPGSGPPRPKGQGTVPAASAGPAASGTGQASKGGSWRP